MLSRRDILAGMAALPLLGAARGSFAASGEPLAALAADKGLFFGAAMTSDQLVAEDDYTRMLLEECGVWTPEWQLKWGEIELEPGTRTYDGVDRIINAAKAGGMRVRGHALLWHEQWPDWGTRLGAPEDWDRHVKPWLVDVTSRYADAIFQWDVVNEPIEPEDGVSDGLRITPFHRMLGRDYIQAALEVAHECAPEAALYINEYGICYDEVWQEKRRTALLKLCERLLKVGVPLHGIGIQSHLDIANTFNPSVFARFLDELAGFGLDVMLTELDVREGDRMSGSLADRKQRAADEVSKVVSVAVDQAALRGVIVWSLSDRFSWLRNVRNITENQGLPFDDTLTPSPMRAALAEVFQHAPVRHA